MTTQQMIAEARRLESKAAALRYTGYYASAATLRKQAEALRKQAEA